MNLPDIRVGQQLPGHAQLDTTSINTQVAITHPKQVCRHTHPAAVIEIENEKPEC